MDTRFGHQSIGKYIESERVCERKETFNNN